ncbi:unnamed protein product [Camellia sinensis]
MKTFLLIFVAFMLILGTLQTNAERLTMLDRQLLSDGNLGRKVNIGANYYGINGKEGAKEIDETKTTTTDDDENNNNDDVNQSYGKLGHGSSTDAHHHIYIDSPTQIP